MQIVTLLLNKNGFRISMTDHGTSLLNLNLIRGGDPRGRHREGRAGAGRDHGNRVMRLLEIDRWLRSERAEVISSRSSTPPPPKQEGF